MLEYHDIKVSAKTLGSTKRANAFVFCYTHRYCREIIISPFWLRTSIIEIMMELNQFVLIMHYEYCLD